MVGEEKGREGEEGPRREEGREGERRGKKKEEEGRIEYPRAENRA